MSGGNNMESLLMGGDDSSSGESDEEVNVPMGSTAASAVAAMPAPPPAAPAPAPSIPGPSPGAPTGGNSPSADLARLKSLYSSQPRKQQTPRQGGASPGGPGTPQTSNATATRPSPPVQQQQQQQQQPQQQQPMQTSRPAPAPSTVRPLMPNRPHNQPNPLSQSQPSSQPQQQVHPPQRSHSQSSRSSQNEPDPYAPTPLHRIKERHQQKQMEAQQRHMTPPTQSASTQPPQQSHLPSRSMPPPSNTNPSSRNAVPQQGSSRSTVPPQGSSRGAVAPPGSSRGGVAPPQDRAAMERELRRQKEKFLMFTRVLIKYLEQKDPSMHQRAKSIIKDCAERNKRQEPGYESVTASMKTRLKQLVGDQYWKRAEAYLKHFLEQKKTGASSGSGRPEAPSRPATASTNYSSSSQPRQQQQPPPQPQGYSEQEKARKLQAAVASKQQAAASTPNIANMRQEVTNKIEAISASSSSTPKASATSTASTPGGTTTPKGSSTGSSKKQSTSKRKSGSSTPTGSSRKSAAASTAAATTPTSAKSPAPQAPPPVEPVEMPPREYKEIMEVVDHAIDYDWTTAGLLLGSKNDLQLTEEQRNLLYGDSKPKTPSVTTTGPRPGWGKRNIVSARAAWAKVRLREQTSARTTAPVVADGLLSLPNSVASSPPPTTPEGKLWVNEETAEQDVALAMLSEGCEVYVKGILEKAIHCARQRQNLDGIRLWHQQHSSSTNTTKPALALRLGCDVSRQIAQTAGNAAMTCKRMEQALERQTGVPSHARVLNDETLLNATNMADLALRPQLAKGVEQADFQAKRSFETFGGKNASEPPLGRVPKQAKLEVIDFVMGSHVAEGIGRHRAGTASTSIYF